MRVKAGIESSQGNWGKIKEGNPSGHLGPSIEVSERSLETLIQIVEELLGLRKALFSLFIHQLVKNNNVMIEDFKSFILGITKCLSGGPSAQSHRPGLLASHSGPRSILQGHKATLGWGWGWHLPKPRAASGHGMFSRGRRQFPPSGDKQQRYPLSPVWCR